MELSQISGVVRDLWAFLWPPIVLVVLLALVAWFIARTSVTRALDHLRTLAPGEVVQKAKASLDTWGLAKVVPVAVVFAAILIFYVSGVLAGGIGAALPPTVSFDPDKLIARHMNDWELACAMTAYPGINFSEVPAVAERQKRLEQSKSSSEWMRRAGTYFAGLNIVKFFFLWAVTWTLLGVFISKRIAKPLWRPSLVLTTTFAVGFIMLGLYLFAVEQTIFDDTRDIRAAIVDDKRCLHATGVMYGPSREQKNEIESMKRARWWHLQVEPFRYAQWIYRNIIRGGA